MNEIIETETDQLNVSAAELLNFGLDVLTPNAGGVATHPLLTDSALINVGASAEAGNADSRGVVRDAFPDVGAHEAETGSAIYYFLDDQNRILRGDLISGLQQVIVDGRPPDGILWPRDIIVDIDGEKIYWIETSGGNSSIVFSDTDGGNVQIFTTFTGREARSLAFDNVTNRLYVAFAGPARPIYWFDTDAGAGSAETRFGMVETDNVRDLDVDPNTGMLVWAQGIMSQPQQLVTANQDGSPGSSISVNGLFNGLAINSQTQVITIIDDFTDQATSYDYSLNQIPGTLTVEGESFEYNSSTDNYICLLYTSPSPRDS